MSVEPETTSTAGNPRLSLKLARITRFILAGAIAVVVTLIVIGSQNRGWVNPLSVTQARADGSIVAAPGYLALTMKLGVGHFHLFDTDKKEICTYQLVGDKLRLVAARKFDFDSDIVAGDIQTTKHGHGIEGANGITRSEAKDYAEESKKIIEALKAAKGK